MAEQMAKAAAQEYVKKSEEADAKGDTVQEEELAEKAINASRAYAKLRDKRQDRRKEHHSEPPRSIHDFRRPGTQTVPGIETRDCRMK